MNNDNGIAQADDICVSYKDSKTYGSDGNISMEVSSHSMLIHPLIIANDDIYRSFNKHKRSSSRARGRCLLVTSLSASSIPG